jgi:hypothetical protein
VLDVETVSWSAYHSSKGRGFLPFPTNADTVSQPVNA